MSLKLWNLVADIGGTNARFGLADYASSSLEWIRSYSVAEHSDFEQTISEFLKDVANGGEWESRPKAACLAVAARADTECIQFTNSPWNIERRHIAALLDAPIELINDFAAVGHGIADLKPQDWHQIGGGSPAPEKPIAVLGPGTGLGVCAMVPMGGGYHVIEGEGGHVDFAPTTPQEAAVLNILNKKFGRVSLERLLSGAGIVNIYRALAQLADTHPVHDNPAAITESALQGVESLSVKTLDMFCAVLGSTAGNLGLTLGARGGVYIAGGIVPRFIDFLKNSNFRQRFAAKGRFKSYLANIPVRVVTKENLGLIGAMKKLRLSE